MADPTSGDKQQAFQKSLDAFEVHRQMVVWLFFSTLVLCTVLAAGLGFGFFSALTAVAFAGALGGFLSALRRLYAFQRIFPPDLFFRLNRKTSLYLVIYSLIPSLVGAIAAVALYTLFASNLITGTVFPSFGSSGLPPSPEESFRHFIQNYRPKSDTEYAKSLIWGFIGGFSERFLPDILERMAAGLKDKPS